LAKTLIISFQYNIESVYLFYSNPVLSGVYNLSTSTTCFGQWFFTICTHAHRLYAKRDLVPLTYTNTNNCSVLYHIYRASPINCIQPDDGHSSNGRNM